MAPLVYRPPDPIHRQLPSAARALLNHLRFGTLPLLFVACQQPGLSFPALSWKAAGVPRGPA